MELIHHLISRVNAQSKNQVIAVIYLETLGYFNQSAFLLSQKTSLMTRARTKVNERACLHASLIIPDGSLCSTHVLQDQFCYSCLNSTEYVSFSMEWAVNIFVGLGLIAELALESSHSKSKTL